MQYIVAIDIGVASVGYAVIDKTSETVIEAGSNIFPEASATDNQERRGMRQARRLKRRERTRLDDFTKLWEYHGLAIPQVKKNDIVGLKVKALYESISLDEVYLILYSYLKHRGISYLEDVEDSSVSGSTAYANGLKLNAKELEKNFPCEIQKYRLENIGKYRGQIQIEDDQGEKLDLSNVFTIGAYTKEIQQILDTQKKYHAEIEDEFCEKYLKIFTRKRKYYEGPGNVDSEGRYHEGASTLISRAKSETQVLKRKGSPTINEDGSLSYESVKEEYVDKNGKIQVRTQKSTKMAETKDARTLSSGTPQEEAYADYANSMKSLANQARREMMSTGKIAYSASAKATYSEEVKSLNAKLDLALANAPRERQAQTMANATVAAKRKDNPDMTKAEVKKASQQALAQARSSVGAKRSNIEITDKEWEAIQAGAISENKLTQILNNTNTDTIRQRATPRASTALSTAKQNRIAALSASGYSTSEIAEALGVSSSTVSKYLNGKE